MITVETSKGIPNQMPRISDEMLRQAYIKDMGFAFVSWKWVYPLVKWLNGRKALEVMAGRGALAYALREKEVDIIATDDFSWHNEKIPTWKMAQWTHIENIDAIQAIEKYGKDCPVLIMSWAPYGERIALEVLKKYAEVNPDGLLLSIDEGKGGVVADNAFFHASERIHDESFEEVEYHYESWSGYGDSPKLYRFKGLNKKKKRG